MTQKISSWIHHFSTKRVMLTSLLMMVAFMIFVLPGQAASSQLETGSTKSPDTSFFYTPAALYQLAEDYGEEGRQAYITTRWTFDLIFPIVYAAFLSIGISWFFKFLPGWPENSVRANLLPILASFFDYLENTATSLVMACYPKQSVLIPLLASASTLIKWILVGLSFLVYFLFAGAAFIQWIITLRRSKIK
ncbi:MAG: hypothetical protein MUP11_01065 [Anaerolineales bacterium]|nr:hypothetical protein [Anaerolineales bacterium]